MATHSDTATTDEPLADARDMFAAHTIFRREFGLMPALVRAVPAGDAARTTVVGDHVEMVRSVLEHHHVGEDTFVWPPLRERCPEDCARLADLMEEQHEFIHGILLEIQETLAQWRATTSVDAGEALAEAVEQLVSSLTEHLALEEAQVVPLIEKYVTDAEYSRVAKDQAAEIAPEKLPILFGMFSYEADPSVVDMVVGHMPEEVRPFIRDVGREAYAAHAKELYGTPTPARVTGA